MSLQVAFDFSVQNQWNTGFTAELAITNQSNVSLDAWEVSFEAPFDITNIWSSTLVEESGETFTIANAAWNGDLDPGQTVVFGFNGRGEPVDLVNLTLADPNGGSSGGTPDPDPTPEPEPEPDPEPDPGPSGPPDPANLQGGYYSTSGNQIVDETGDLVRIAGVNWFGLETANYAPHGLWARDYEDMIEQIADLGFNTIRLPFSNALLEAGPNAPNGIDQSPSLDGLTGLEIMDAVIAKAGEEGLRIVLDNHRVTAGDGAQGIWYGNGQSEQDWIDDWRFLADRYAGNETVVGADLFNEPYQGTWGTGQQNDWARAATKAANAIHEVNADLLVFVEGIGVYQGDPYWWGGQLEGVRDHPITINHQDKLVYSPHAYPASIYNQPWFSDPDYPSNLPGVWNEKFGFIGAEATAPLFLGEFGSRLATETDRAWMDTMIEYLEQTGISWTWWSWNPNSGDTGGILRDDWSTPIQEKLDLLARIVDPVANPDYSIPGDNTPPPDDDPNDGNTGDDGDTGDDSSGDDGSNDPPPTESDGLVFDFNLQNSWNNGYVGEVVVRNEGDGRVDGWGAELRLDDDIVNIWGATITKVTGEGYELSSVSWTDAIASGGQVTFGFQAQGAYDPDSVAVAGLDGFA